MSAANIRAIAQRAKALAAAVTAAAAAAQTTASASAEAKQRLTTARSEKYKTKTAKANQQDRIGVLRALVIRTGVAARSAAAALRKAQRAQERGPKAHLLDVDPARARAAGAHLDMSGKDARVIASWDDSHIEKKPAKHVWKNSGTECYWSKGRSSDIEYIRATRDNYIASYCVIVGQMVRGVVHTTEWSLRAPKGMTWSVKNGNLEISAPPSKLVKTKGRIVYAVEAPNTTGLSLAADSYREAYTAEQKPTGHGPDVRAALRSLSRHLGYGWRLGVEKYEGKDISFAARRDDEKYHFRSAEIPYSSATIVALARTIQDAFARRDEEKTAEAKAAADRAVFERDLAATRVTLEDSRQAGNCVEGSLAFAEDKLHISREEIIAGSYLFSVPAKTVLAHATGDTKKAHAACKRAWLRETAVAI